MHLTKLEKEIIQHRLDVPDAMSECLADNAEFNLSYEQAFEIYDERLPGLIAKLTADELLDKWEVEAVTDIANDDTYAHTAEGAIGFEWDDGKEMTPQRASRIWTISEKLHTKLKDVHGDYAHVRCVGLEGQTEWATEAFENAIKVGQLTENSDDANYAGKYMYMHSIQTKGSGFGNMTDHFKNIITRKTDIKVTRLVFFLTKG